MEGIMSLTTKGRLLVAAATLSISVIPAPLAAQGNSAAPAAGGYASCVVAQNRALAKQFVLDRSSLELQPRYSALLNPTCPGAATATPQALRMALAESLLSAEIASIDAAALPTAQPLPLPRLVAANYEPETGKLYAASQVLAMEQRRQEDESALVMYRFGDCVVRSNPNAARAVLQADRDSAQEAQAVQSAMPALSNCVQQGVQYKLDKASLRGALAFAYYSLAHAPKAPQ